LGLPFYEDGKLLSQGKAARRMDAERGSYMLFNIVFKKLSPIITLSRQEFMHAFRVDV